MARVIISEDEVEPVKLRKVIDADNIINNVEFVQELVELDGEFPAPIDIDVTNTKKIDLPLLKWHNYEKIPKKMKLTNSGETCMQIHHQ